MTLTRLFQIQSPWCTVFLLRYSHSKQKHSLRFAVIGRDEISLHFTHIIQDNWYHNNYTTAKSFENIGKYYIEYTEF